MKQVIQNFKTGELYVDDLPVPALSEGMVLVRNAYSLISAGTERGTVKVAQSSLIGKARQRPDLVAQVIQNVRKEGLSATLSKVRTKLDSLKALGYSTAGTVIASLDPKGEFKPGDRVACAGQDYASHAEIVAVPRNLVVRIPDDVTFNDAAFTTLGAIAMQGVRQAEPTLGEKVCVIGLGLLGQITCQLLRANGCAVMGIDLNEGLIEIAKEHGADLAMNRSDKNLLSACESFTKGNGFDAVIITAAAPTNDPIELSAEILRKKGRVIVVGAVNMDIPRDPHFYRKELDLRMSCSYGPGRYDVDYEENGMDYPLAYVRWTEQRNMESFLELISSGQVNVNHLVTDVFDISDAKEAYDIVLGKNKKFHIGLLLSYPGTGEERQPGIRVKPVPVGEVCVGFIGAGSFAQSYLIPNIKDWGAALDTVITSRGITAKSVLEKFGFAACSTEPEEVFNSSSVNTVFIATPHMMHAEFVTRSLKAGKSVFVEKPLALNQEQLEEVVLAVKNSELPVMVGFNRRFAPVSRKIRETFETVKEPLVINIRVNAGFIPKDHWTQQPSLGGGRIVGEMCHFIDLMQFISDAEPVKVHAYSVNSQNTQTTPDDNIAISVSFSDGSVGNMVYVAGGDKSMSKERVEVFGGGISAVIKDFREGELYRNGRRSKIKSDGKGHREEVFEFLSSVKEGKQSPISFRSAYLTTLTTLKIQDSIKTGLPQEIIADVEGTI